MNLNPTIDYLVIFIYILFVLGIGVYFSRKEKNSSDYLLGGRNMSFIAIGISTLMSVASTISIVMVPGEIFNHGLTLFVLGSTLGAVLAIPSFLMFVRFYFKLGSYTPYEYLEKRYNPTIRTVVAMAGLYTRTIYLAMVLVASSRVFEGAYNWPSWMTILIVGICGTAYTVMGGMKAVVWSDVLQFVVLFGGFGVVIYVLCEGIEGGAVTAVVTAFQQGRGLPEFSTWDFYKVTPYVRLCFWILLLKAISDPLTSACSDQIVIQRYLSTKNWKEAYKSQILSTVIRILYAMCLWFIGLALFSFYNQHPDPSLSSGDNVLFKFISTRLPTPMPGIFMAAMLAAIMSTMDSGVNSMATIWLKEVHARFINKSMSDIKELRVSRYATFIVGAFAICLGLLVDFSGKWLEQSIAEIGTLFELLTMGILPVFLFGILSKRANPAMIGMLFCYSFGEGFAMKIWYALSRSTVQNWQLGDPLEWAGPLGIVWMLLPLAFGLLSVAIWKILKRSHSTWAWVVATFSALWLGVTQGMLVWFIYSNLFIDKLPLERSFSFALTLPLTLIVGFIALRFCKDQPKEKYQGLTLKTINEKIIS